MKDLKSFLKLCIAEVLVEPEPQKAKPIQGFRAFVKQCIAECIVEPDKKLRAVSVHGHPEKLQMARLIKECTLEVLKENLSEGFDPTSQGPNMPQDNPYPAWNNKMRTLEEDGGTVAHGRYAQQAGATPLQTPQDYEEVKTFQEIRDKEDPTGTHHDLHLECIKCGNSSTCRCRKPKRTFKGICDDCAKEKVQESKATNVPWNCPHCGKSAGIIVECESVSDYIACADCEHCGKEINDPKLDHAIYEIVLNHYKKNTH